MAFNKKGACKSAQLAGANLVQAITSSFEMFRLQFAAHASI